MSDPLVLPLDHPGPRAQATHSAVHREKHESHPGQLVDVASVDLYLVRDDATMHARVDSLEIFDLRLLLSQFFQAGSAWRTKCVVRQPALLGFAAVTDEPPPEVSAAGHDRCIIPLKPENLEVWPSPKTSRPGSDRTRQPPGSTRFSTTGSGRTTSTC